MKFALVGGVKKEALNSGERGICLCCGAETIAYCGNFMIYHWKHKILSECDIWSEGETDWHRKWKNEFPTSFQESLKIDGITGEKHIADILHPTKGIIIEFQHSQISLQEIKSRENFYRKMIWVIDILPIKSNIFFHKNLNDAFYHCVILPWSINFDRILRELRKLGRDDEAIKKIDENDVDEYISKFEKKYKDYNVKENYFLMQWKYQHKRWNFNTLPLFFDIGDQYLYMNIENIKIWNGFVVKRFLKKDFITRFIHD